MNPLQIKRTEAGYQFGNLIATGLPRAQSHALLLRARGLSFLEAARVMGCGEKNVKNAISALFYKTRSDNTPALITAAFESGLLRILCVILSIHLCAGQIFDNEARRELRTRPRGSRQITRRPPSSGEQLLWDPETSELIASPLQFYSQEEAA